MLFVNTRPDDRAQALTECLEQANFTVIALPVLELRARPLDQSLKDLYLKLNSTQIIVVVSPKAVEIGLFYLEQSGLSLSDLDHIQWVAVGKKTALALEKYGIESHIPDVETSEGMLSLPLFEDLKSDQNVAFWRGEGGRQFMMQTLQQQQRQVLNFVLYERFCPESAEQNFQTFLSLANDADGPYWMCISSEASWKNWLKLCEQHLDILRHFHILVLGGRLYQLLTDDKKNLNIDFKMARVDDLDPALILRTINDLKKVL